MMLNAASSLTYQITAVICGFILPRFLLTYYGSEVNGLVSSITQFLGLISLAECGVGAVVQSSLYRPLASQDMISVSKIVISSEHFFRRIAALLLIYTAGLMLFYPYIVSSSFDYIFTLTLILVISLSTFAQYYLGMTYRLLLTADQLGCIYSVTQIAALVINTISSVILMKCGASIHMVKLVTSLIFILQPAVLSVVAKRRYALDKNIKLTEEPIKQKWNGLAQHISSVVLGNTDVAVLTLLSTLENVSVYAVYHLVVNGVKQIVLSLTSGMQAMLGNMLAKEEMEALHRTFDFIEWMLHTLVTFVFTMTAILIVPFVKVYTARITDVNYIVPAFAFLITIAQAFYCLRLPYNLMVLAAGHYKQTQKSAIAEAFINVALSIVLVFKFGLVGVAIGTIAAMAYRTMYLAWYLSKNILHRKLQHFVKHVIVDGVSSGILILLIQGFNQFFTMQEDTYLSWFILAVKTGITGLTVFIILNAAIYRENLKKITVKVTGKHKK